MIQDHHLLRREVVMQDERRPDASNTAGACRNVAFEITRGRARLRTCTHAAAPFLHAKSSPRTRTAIMIQAYSAFGIFPFMGRKPTIISIHSFDHPRTAFHYSQ